MDFNLPEINMLYGDTFYIVGEGEAAQGKKPVEEASPSSKAQAHPAEAPTNEKAPETKAQNPAEETKASPPAQSTGAITWRTKPASQVLFILHQHEIKDKELGELLKKIVASIGIPFENAGFGIVKGTPNHADFAEMPNPYGVAFGTALQPAPGQNPMQVPAGSIFFCNTLSELKDNKEYKMILWNYLKGLKEKLN